MSVARQYPIDLITYLTPQLTVPPEVILARDNTEKAGFYVLPITGDKFNIIGRRSRTKQSKSIKHPTSIYVILLCRKWMNI